MFLAFKMSDLVTVPFGWLLGVLYDLTSNYGVAMILFALIVQAVLTPINAKSKKSMMKMSRLQPRIQDIQRRYAHDQQKQNEEIQKLQQEEGASMGMGGCLWSFVVNYAFGIVNVVNTQITLFLLYVVKLLF